MPSVCFYFQVHQPYRLRDLRIRDCGGEEPQYFDQEKNRAIFRKVAEKCYLPANRLMLSLLEEFPSFRISYSLSGVFLDQCAAFGEDVLQSFRALAATGRTEFLAETYYHSLSSIASLPEFVEQVTMHTNTIEKLCGRRPTILRNTELVFSNEIAQIARLMGFRGILAEGADHLLRGRNPNVPYAIPRFRLPASKERIVRRLRPHAAPARDFAVLLKNYRLSDDVAFRFSDRSWAGFPLMTDTYAEWIAGAPGHSVNLFMDYETFGEHQWEDTGIFQFLASLPRALQHRGIGFLLPSEAIATYDGNWEVFDAHAPVSWADMERDLSAWLGNRIQQSSLAAVYALEKPVKARHDPALLETWRRLLTSDHLYYMSTKYWSDGDVHKYFSPYDSPYEAYRRFSHALCDLRARINASASCELRAMSCEKRHKKQLIKSNTQSSLRHSSGQAPLKAQS